MKNLIILIVVAAAIYLGLAYKNFLPEEYIPETLQTSIPELDQEPEVEEIPIERRMHTLGKKLLTPLNATSYAGEIATIANELRANSSDYSPEALNAGLKYCKQLDGLNRKKNKLFKELKEVQSREEIQSKMNSRDHTAKHEIVKKKLIDEKKYNWEQVVNGTTPIVKKQLEEFMKLIKE